MWRPKTRSRAQWKPGVLVKLARKPWLYWLTTAALMAATVVALTQANQSAQLLRQDWGEQAEVLVLTRHVSVGDPLAGSLELQSLPRAMVPATATSMQPPPDAVAGTDLEQGEVLLASRVRTADSELPPGMIAVAVPKNLATPPLQPGYPVLLVSTLDPFGAGSQAVMQAEVLSVQDSTVTVIVPQTDLNNVMAALLQGTVGIARTG